MRDDDNLEGAALDAAAASMLPTPQQASFELRPQPQIVPMTSAACAEVWGALAVAQSEIEPPKRTKKARIQTRGGASYEYSYAPLEEIDRVIRLPLGRQKLMCQQYLVSRGGHWLVRTIIGHASGQWIAGDYPVLVNENPNKPQAFASGVTYARRYGKCLLLNLAPEDDDDAQATAGEGGEGGKPIPAPAEPQKEAAVVTAEERARANGAYQRVRRATREVQSLPELDRQGIKSLSAVDITLIRAISLSAWDRLVDEDAARRHELGGKG